MTDRVLIPFGPEVLVLTEAEFAAARARGRERVGAGEPRGIACICNVYGKSAI